MFTYIPMRVVLVKINIPIVYLSIGLLVTKWVMTTTFASQIFQKLAINRYIKSIHRSCNFNLSLYERGKNCMCSTNVGEGGLKLRT